MQKFLLCAVTAGLLAGCSGGGSSNSGGGSPSGGGTSPAAAVINQLNSSSTQQAVDQQPFPFMIRNAVEASPPANQAVVTPPSPPQVKQLIAMGPAAVNDILNEFQKTPTINDDAYLSLLAYALEKIGDKRAIPVLANWLDNNMFVGFPGWVTDFVTNTLKVLGGQTGLNTTSFVYQIDEKFDTLLQARTGASSSGTSQNLVSATAVSQSVTDGNLTAAQKNVCNKRILVTGVNAAGEQVTLSVDYRVVTKDINDFINDPSTSDADRAAAMRRRANWGVVDEEAYSGTDYAKDAAATVTDNSNCGGSVTQQITNQLTTTLGIPLTIGKGQADATAIRNIASTFGSEVSLKDIDPLTVIAIETGGSAGHVEVPVVTASNNSILILSKYNYGFLRFHTVKTDSTDPAFTQFKPSVDYVKGDDEPGSGNVQVKFYKIDPSRIKSIVVDSSRCPCTPGDPNGIPVQISQPTGDQTADRVITVSGSVGSGTGDTPVLSGTTLSVNGNPQNISIANGSFTASVVLQSGSNVIKVSVEGVDGRRGCAVKNITSTTPKTTLSATLTWDLDQADLDLYVTQPDGRTAWYQNLQTTSGGRLDVDNTQGFGPENYFVSFGPLDPIGPGSYKIAVHYFSDHQKNANQPTRPATWRIVLLINEGTPSAKYQVFTGTLSVDNPDNHDPGSSGPDWAPVTTANVTAASGP